MSNVLRLVEVQHVIKDDVLMHRLFDETGVIDCGDDIEDWAMLDDAIIRDRDHNARMIIEGLFTCIDDTSCDFSNVSPLSYRRIRMITHDKFGQACVVYLNAYEIAHHMYIERGDLFIEG